MNLPPPVAGSSPGNEHVTHQIWSQEDALGHAKPMPLGQLHSPAIYVPYVTVLLRIPEFGVNDSK